MPYKLERDKILSVKSELWYNCQAVFFSIVY